MNAHTAKQTLPLMISSALFVAAGGFVHFREWFDTYRHLPGSVAGVAVVRVGFPIEGFVSAVVVGALVYCIARRSRFTPLVIAGAIVFEAAALATLIATRTGNVFGWSEHVWTLGANESRAVEIGALVALVAVAAVGALTWRPPVPAPSR